MFVCGAIVYSILVQIVRSKTTRKEEMVKELRMNGKRNENVTSACKVPRGGGDYEAGEVLQ